MRKKYTMMLLVLVLSLCLFMLQPYASQRRLQPQDTIYDFEGLKEAIQTSATNQEALVLEIGDDIFFTETLEVPDGANITLVDDGSGRTLTKADGVTISAVQGLIRINNGGSLKIYESTTGSVTIDGKFVNAQNPTNPTAVIVVDGGTFVLYGGTITGYEMNNAMGGNYTGLIYTKNAGRVEIHGGLITGLVSSGNYAAPVILTGNAQLHMTGGKIAGNTNKVTQPYTSGGVIITSGKFIMDGGEISGNLGGYAGAVLAMSTNSADTGLAEVIMNDGIIRNNSAHYGGGVMVVAHASFTMNDGLIEANHASVGGGVATYDYYDYWAAYESAGVDTSKFVAAFTMNGGTIQGNVAHSDYVRFPGGVNSDVAVGGGIYVASQNVTLNRGRITRNESEHQGGGIYIGSIPYVLKLDNAIITDNEAVADDKTVEGVKGGTGGGIWLCSTGTVDVSATEGMAIYGNHAFWQGDDIASNEKADPDAYYLKLSKRALGGALSEWHDDADGGDGLEVDAQKANTEYAYWRNELSSDGIQLAENQANVIISGNRSGRGGGIGTNGKITSTDGESLSLKVRKKWVDDTEETRPASIEVHLKADGVLLGESVTLSEENGWTAVFEDLPASLNEGSVMEYFGVAELAVDGYTTSYSKMELVEPQDGQAYLELTITNTPQAPPVEPSESESPTPSETEAPSQSQFPVPSGEEEQPYASSGGTPRTGDGEGLVLYFVAGLAVLIPLGILARRKRVENL